MFRGVISSLATCCFAICTLMLVGPILHAQSNCVQCDIPPDCRDSAESDDDAFATSAPKNCQPLEIMIESDIDFGRVVIMGRGEGRVILDLASGRRTLIGSVDDLGGVPITGRAVITGAPLEQVVVDFPSEVAMRDTSGGNARIRNFVTDLQGFPTLDIDGRLEFRFSGTLIIGSETKASGNLRGRVPIRVEYP